MREASVGGRSRCDAIGSVRPCSILSLHLTAGVYIPSPYTIPGFESSFRQLPNPRSS